MTIRNLIHRLQDEAGWTESTTLEMLIEYWDSRAPASDKARAMEYFLAVLEEETFVEEDQKEN